MKSSVIVLISSAVMVVFLATGCDSSSNGSPTNPGGGLQVDPFNTATQPGPGAVRIQVRMRVVRGLGDLGQALAAGSAQVEICDNGGCTGGDVSPDFAEAACANVGLLSFGEAWLNDDVVGVDFCIPELRDGLVFETTVMDGTQRSNVVTTRCAASGVGLTCGSG